MLKLSPTHVRHKVCIFYLPSSDTIVTSQALRPQLRVGSHSLVLGTRPPQPPLKVHASQMLHTAVDRGAGRGRTKGWRLREDDGCKTQAKVGPVGIIQLRMMRGAL